MASFSDDFNRSDGALGSNWETLTGYSALQIDTNKAEAGAVGACAMRVTTAAATFAADHYAEFTVSSITNFDFPAALVRASGTRCYAAFVRPSRIDLYDYADSATRTDIGAYYSGTINNGDVIRLEVSGTTLTIKVNGSTVKTETDSAYSSGQPGLLYEFGDGNTTKIDSFAAADLGGGGSLGVRSYYAFG